MKFTKRTLWAALVIATVSVSGAAQATTVLNASYNEISDDAGQTAPERSAVLGPSATLPEAPSWAMMIFGFAGIVALSGNHQAKKRREAIAS